MKRHSEETPFYATRGYRLVSGSFGALVICTGLYFLFGASSTGEFVASAVLVVVGANSAACAYSGREPWLSKLGPLP